MEEKEYKDLFDSLKNIKDDDLYIDSVVSLISELLYKRDRFVKNSNNASLREYY